MDNEARRLGAVATVVFEECGKAISSVLRSLFVRSGLYPACMREVSCLQPSARVKDRPGRRPEIRIISEAQSNATKDLAVEALPSASSGQP